MNCAQLYFRMRNFVDSLPDEDEYFKQFMKDIEDTKHCDNFYEFEVQRDYIMEKLPKDKLKAIEYLKKEKYIYNFISNAEFYGSNAYFRSKNNS